MGVSAKTTVKDVDPLSLMENEPQEKRYSALKTPGGEAHVQSSCVFTAQWRKFGPSAWASKYQWSGNLAQILIVVTMGLFMVGQMLYYTNEYREGLKKTIDKWWGVPEDRSSRSKGHSEMVRPTYFFMFCIFPLAISVLLVEYLKHFNVRRITSKYVLQMGLVLRRKPRVGKWVSYWSYGEWIFLLGLIVGGNILVFYFNVNRRILRLHSRQRKSGEAEEVPFDNLLQFISVTLGFNSIYNLAFLFLPATRNCAWMEFLNISYANGIKYHRWLGVATVVTALLHCVGYYWLWIRQGRWVDMAVPCFDCSLGERHGYKVWFNVFGELALIFFLIIGATSIPFIRRRMYETFYYVHHLFIPAVIFCVLHWGGILWWLLPTFMLYVVSRCCSSSNAFVPVPVTEFTTLENDIIKVVVERSAMRDGHYAVGQFVYLNVPAISKLQWHAFTISSSPRASATTLTILLKSLGDWTTDLVEYIDDCKNKNVRPTVYMDGYYGASLEAYQEYNTICLIGGGIGVTPLFSILEDIAARLCAGDQLRQRVVFIFTFREISLLEEIHPVLMKIREMDPQEEYFTWHFYLTRPPTDEVLNRKIDFQRLQGVPHLQATSYAFDKTRKEPEAFGEPLRSRTYKSLTQVSIFTVTLFFVGVLTYGGKIKADDRAHLWPLQQFAEVILLFLCGAVAFVFIYLDRRHNQRVISETNLADLAALGSAQLSLPASDLATYQDLLHEYRVAIGKRPNMADLVRQTLVAHEEFSAATSHLNPTTTIGVFMSGPDALKRNTEYAIAELGSQNFDTHEEEFEL